jgi:hypothetical protein
MTELERLHDACLIENLRSASRRLQGYDLRRHEPGDRESAPSRGIWDISAIPPGREQRRCMPILPQPWGALWSIATFPEWREFVLGFGLRASSAFAPRITSILPNFAALWSWISRLQSSVCRRSMDVEANPA